MLKTIFILLLLGSALLLSCNNRNRAVTALAARDTSITAVNAYTRLVLDSSELLKFLDEKAVTGQTDTSIKNFYNARNYQYAWFNEEGLTEQAEAFWSLREKRLAVTRDSSGYNKALDLVMDTLLNDDDHTLPAPAKTKSIELELTLLFFNYIRSSLSAGINPAALQWYIPVRKVAPIDMLDSFLAAKTANWKPLGASFYRLRDKLLLYGAIDRHGGWNTIQFNGKKLSPGDSGSVVVQLKRRLAASGDFKGDTGDIYKPHCRKP